MTQTAAILSTRQALHISHTEPVFSLAENQETVSIEDLSSVENQFYYQSPAFYYKDRAKLGFRLTERFQPYFALIKGLIEFHRSRDLRFTFNRPSASFEIDLEIKHSGDLNDFLVKVYGWLNQEIQFKATLKKIIQFENRYKLEKAALYNSLNKISPRHN